MESAPIVQQKEEEILFYEKKSNLKLKAEYKAAEGAQGHYPVLIAQHPDIDQQLAIANTNRTIQLLDVTKGEIACFNQKKLHRERIECMKYTGVNKENTLANFVMTASEDKLIKLWDTNSGNVATNLQYGGMPFYSVDTNAQIIAAGTNSDLVFWDIRHTKAPLEVLDESHNEDITALKFHHRDPQKVITCSTDTMVNVFNFEGKASMKEDDGVIDLTYCSEQPLLDCGFIGNVPKFYVQTSVNTIEICNLETADLFTKIEKFPHQVDYVISLQPLTVGDSTKLLLHCGNNNGEVFVYDVDYNKKQVVDPQGNVKEDNLTLVDIILTEESQGGASAEDMEMKEPSVIRNCLVNPRLQLVFCTSEANRVMVFDQKGAGQQQANIGLAGGNLGPIDMTQFGSADDDLLVNPEDDETNVGKMKIKKVQKKYKPF